MAVLKHLQKMSLTYLSDIKTDDRFILKQMPRLEVQSFLDFAPHYFTYITNAVQQKVFFFLKCFYVRQCSVFCGLVGVPINHFHLSKKNICWRV